MKTYGKEIFDKIIDKENIRKAIYNGSKGKRHRGEVIKVLSNIDYHIDKIYNILANKEYNPRMTKQVIINENDSRHKTRRIRKPKFMYDQIIHHAVMQVIKPLIVSTLIEHAYGSVPGKGLHKASKYISKWMKDYKKTKYCLKLDIHHFYESIDKEILKSKIAEKFRDKRLTTILFKIIDSFEETGIPLGYYTSQWFVLIYISEFDHYIKEQLKVKYYVRYMDDMVILGSNKRELHKLKLQIEEYLKNKLHLKLKSNWQIFPIAYVSKKDNKEHGRPLDFLGFQFYHDRTILRKHDLIALTRKVSKVAKKSFDKLTKNDCLSVVSRLGMLKYADTYEIFQKWINSKIDIKALKAKVSILDKIENYSHPTTYLNKMKDLV